MGLLLSFFYLSWCTKYYELQRHFMQLRGYDTMNCNINDANTQRHFMGVRGHGHDKSAPTPTGWTWKDISTNNHVWFIYYTKCMATNIPQYSFIAQMYGNEHTARRRGRFIAPVFQSEPNGFDVSKWCETQRHFMQLRGYDTMNCNINGGNMQRHFMGVRGYGHDKSDPYGCWRIAILWVFTYIQIPKNCAYTYTCNLLWHNNIHRMPTFAL